VTDREGKEVTMACWGAVSGCDALEYLCRCGAPGYADHGHAQPGADPDCWNLITRGEDDDTEERGPRDEDLDLSDWKEPDGG
jgi:hypothetical protein